MQEHGKIGPTAGGKNPESKDLYFQRGARSRNDPVYMLRLLYNTITKP